MIKSVARTLGTLALAACLLLFPGLAGAALADSFKDTAGQWSRQVVEKSYVLGLMKGYPGDLFKPEDPVSRLEAIAIIIRAMGLEDQAKALDWKNSGIKLPPGITWGQGHLVMAAQKGLLDKNYVYDLMFDRPIPREEVATLVAVALMDRLKVRGDVQKMAFSDTSRISTFYQQYVADVTQNNIMQGLENNRFGPNEVMKRGQMAALIVRAAQDGWFTYGAENIFNGPLAIIESASGTLKVTGDALRLIDPKAVFFRDSKPAALNDFKIGDNVTVILADGKVKYMESSAGSTVTPGTGSGAAVSPGQGTSPAETSLTGKIVDRAQTGNLSLKIRDSANQDRLYPLDTVVTITDGDSPKDMSYLVDGQFVTVKIKNGAIYNIKMLRPDETQGEVTVIIPNYFTVKTPTGENRIFLAKPDELKVSKNGSLLPFSSLKAGDTVRVVSLTGEAREIYYLESSTLKGQIRTVDPFYRIISVVDYSGARKDYEIELRALIRKGDESIGIGALKPGDDITMKVGVTGKVSEIYMEDPDLPKVSGKVTDIWYGHYPRMYIDSIKYEIADTAVVTRDRQIVTLKDIIIGSQVDARTKFSNNRDIITGIEILNDTSITVEGTVTRVSGAEITLEQSSRLEFTFPVDSNCVFTDQTSSSSDVSEVEDVGRGWSVKLILSGGKVRELRVLSR